jgi:hypothetical protein
VNVGIFFVERYKTRKTTHIIKFNDYLNHQPLMRNPTCRRSKSTDFKKMHGYNFLNIGDSLNLEFEYVKIKLEFEIFLVLEGK